MCHRQHEDASQEQLNILRRSLGKARLSSKDIESFKGVIKDTGALSKAKAESRKHARKAMHLIEKTGMHKETKTFFKKFIEYVAESLDWYK